MLKFHHKVADVMIKPDLCVYIKSHQKKIPLKAANTAILHPNG